MERIKEYLLFAFIIENVFAQTRLFPWMNNLFYVFLGLAVLLLLFGNVLTRDLWKSCKVFLLLSFVFIFYQFSIGINTLTVHTGLYLIAKIATFVIIVVSVEYNWELYARKTPLIFSYLVVFLLIYAFISGNAEIDSNGRQALGFTNSNTTSSMSVFAFAGFLFGYKELGFWKLLLLMFCLFGILAGGSRKGVLLLFIILLLYRGVSFNVVPLVLMLGIFVFILLPEANIHLSGIDRVIATIEGKEGTHRELERMATQIMIDQKPLTGWGFDAKNVGLAAKLSGLGSHNGYMEMTKFMGYIFSILWFGVIGRFIIPLLKYIRSEDDNIRYHLSIVIALLVGALYEALFVGVHELTTNMFFISLAVLTIYHYRQSIDEEEETSLLEE